MIFRVRIARIWYAGDSNTNGGAGNAPGENNWHPYGALSKNKGEILEAMAPGSLSMSLAVRRGNLAAG